MKFNELIKEKSNLILQLEKEKNSGQRRIVLELASHIACLEGELVHHFLKENDVSNAVISIVSQGSCLKDAKRFHETFRLFRKALELSNCEATRAWLKKEITDLPSQVLRENIFFQSKPRIGENKSLRRPQIFAYEAARKYFSETNGHAIIQLPVGCGKTGVISLVPFGISTGRVLAIAPNLEIRKNLFDNLNFHGTKSFLKRLGVLDGGLGPIAAYLDQDANILDCDAADIVVSNIQQLAAKGAGKWLKKYSPDYFDMVLIDEGHHNVASTWERSINHFPDSKIISFTATPFRSDGEKIKGERIYRFPIKDAIKEGYIKDIASRRLEPEEIYFTYQGSSRRVPLEEILKLRDEDWFNSGVAMSPECNKSTVDASIQAMNELRESGEKHQIIGVACSIDHAKAIRGLYQERGLKAEVIHSKLEEAEQGRIRSAISDKTIDAIVQVQMLGEGADYPHLSVAAIFRPFRHLMPYVQFVGRIMRVVKQDSPGNKANRGFVVSHVGLNVDRWWEELKAFDSDDEAFFEDLATGSKDFLNDSTNDQVSTKRKRFTNGMKVIEEALVHFVEVGFLPEDADQLIEDLVLDLSLRGFDLDLLGVSKEALKAKLLDSAKKETKGKVEKLTVPPQEARKVARQRLNERVNSGAKQLLNDLGFSVGGIELPKFFPAVGGPSNITTAIKLLHIAVNKYLGATKGEKDLLSEEELKRAHDDMDKIIDDLVSEIKKKGRK